MSPTEDPSERSHAAEVNLVDDELDLEDIDRTREQCIDLLRSAVPGVSHERAGQLLRSVSPDDDPTLWCEAAIVQMAVDNEVDDEADELSKAMRESLEEARVKQATETPLEDRPWDEIQGSFSSSSDLCLWVSSVLSEDPCMKMCFEEDEQLKKLLVRFLRMEKRCKQWYPQSFPYFARFAERMKRSSDHTEDFPVKLNQILEDEMELLEGAVFAFPGSENPIPTIFCCENSPPKTEVINLL